MMSTLPIGNICSFKVEIRSATWASSWGFPQPLKDTILTKHMPARCFDRVVKIISFPRSKLVVADWATVIFCQVLILYSREDCTDPFTVADAKISDEIHDFLEVYVRLFSILNQSGEMRESEL
jgi:hypothetical protein